MAATPLAVPGGVTVPQVGEHEAPPCVRFQVTPLFAESFFSVAVNSCVRFTPRRAEVGEIETEIGAGTTVTLAEPDFVGSATEVAVSVTIGFAGTVDGGV